MANITEQVATEFNFPNITVYRVLSEGVLSSYRARPNEGYAMYDPNANETELDPNTMVEVPVTNYRTIAGFPKDYDFERFPYVAVLRSEVDENYIY